MSGRFAILHSIRQKLARKLVAWLSRASALCPQGPNRRMKFSSEAQGAATLSRKFGWDEKDYAWVLVSGAGRTLQIYPYFDSALMHHGRCEEPCRPIQDVESHLSPACRFATRVGARGRRRIYTPLFACSRERSVPRVTRQSVLRPLLRSAFTSSEDARNSGIYLRVLSSLEAHPLPVFTTIVRIWLHVGAYKEIDFVFVCCITGRPFSRPSFNLRAASGLHRTSPPLCRVPSRVEQTSFQCREAGGISWPIHQCAPLNPCS
ncbi:hypothetical protein R3P38DRAFT_3122726 [Favolaschia claudopus]|uniref:Uncharacterized protein n=1 Tax=Favolaschia claudopus TaxID=2862362 RepID=A0AAV9ZCB8_9AGAR